MATEPQAPELRLQHVWTLIVDASDFLLILKALGGRLREDEDDAADELGDRLTELRGKALISSSRDGERLIDVIADKRERESHG
jgi:hypothetical protein